MKKVFVMLIALAVSAFVAVDCTSAAKETDSGKDKPQYSAEEMAAWQKAATPGPHHAYFTKMAGTWKAECKFWMQPGGEPQVAEMKAEFEPLFDGRFVVQKLEGEMMGMPFRGMGISGFDNLKGKHTMVWIDNMGTAMSYSEGKCSDHCKVETHYSSTMDPMTGKEQKIKSIARIIDDNNQVFEYFMIGEDGGEFKSMEITYTRK